MANANVGNREDATIFRKVGGKAFPNDYNWKCPICGNDCRSFELTCSYCEHGQQAESQEIPIETPKTLTNLF